MKKLSAIVIGATGATGQELVKLLLKDSNFIKVKIFVQNQDSEAVMCEDTSFET